MLGESQVALTGPAGSKELDNSGNLAPDEFRLVKITTTTLPCLARLHILQNIYLAKLKRKNYSVINANLLGTNIGCPFYLFPNIVNMR